MTTKKNKPAKNFIDQNPVEAFRDLGSGVVKSLANDVVKSSASDLWGQILGSENYKGKNKKEAGDLEEGQELDLANLKEKQLANTEPGFNYRREILHGERKTTAENGREVEVKIQEIIIELKRLILTSKELEIEFHEVTVQQLPKNPGKYHITFFEWLLSVIQAARLKVEDSASWLALFSSKKKKKQYWNMFKKHGTTFGLSNERVVATQTG